MLPISKLAGILETQSSQTGDAFPVFISLGTPTPEQMGVRAVQSRVLAPNSTVQVEYKQTNSSTWISDRILEPMFLSEAYLGTQYNPALGSSEPYTGAVGTTPNADGWPGTVNGVAGTAPADGFTGFVYHLSPGTVYDVRLKLTEASVISYSQAQQYTTASLPSNLPTVTKTCTPATLVATLATLLPGEHLQLQSGTYASFTVSVSGSVNNPIYISCASGAVVNRSSAGQIITIAGDYIVFDSMRVTGTGVDSELQYLLNGGALTLSYCEAFYQNRNTVGITIRNSYISGVDLFFKGWKRSTGWLIYSNVIEGNNAFNVRHVIPPGSVYPNAGWNDSGVAIHGLGNCIFQNTWSGFGDTWKNAVSTESSGSESRGNFFYRNLIKWGADDGVEMDNAVSGGIYHNVFMNTATGLSVDGTFEGPIDFFGNTVISACRGPLKVSSDSRNVKIINNTFVLGDKQFTNHGMYISYAFGPNARFDYINNLLVYQGTGNALFLDQIQADMKWNHNAWFPDRNFSMRTIAVASTLSAMKTAAAPQMVGDVVTTTNPFTNTITVNGYTTEYTGTYDVSLNSGMTPLNAGIHIPGFTNGFTGGAPSMGSKWGGQISYTVGASSPTLNLSGSNWTPNRDVAGKVLASDWQSLPLTTSLLVLGSLSKMQDVKGSASGYYKALSGADDFPRQMGAWGGGAYDHINKAVWLAAEGGHGDGHQCNNGVYSYSLEKLVWTREKDAADLSNTQAWDPNSLTFVSFGSDPYNQSPGPGMSLWPNYPHPLANGTPGGQHSSWSKVYLQPSVMQAAGYTGNVRGGLAIASTYQALLNLDTMVWETPSWSYPYNFPDLNIFSFECQGKVYALSASFRVSRFTLTGTSSTTWSPSSKGVFQYSWATTGTPSWHNSSGFFAQSRELGQIFWIGSLNGTSPVVARRIRVDAAITAGTTNWSTYVDSPTLTGPDVGDFTPSTLNAHEVFGGVFTDYPLRAALTVYDATQDCLWVLGNAANAPLYKITGISGSTWTVTKIIANAAISADALYSFNRGAFVQPAAGVTALVRISQTSSYAEVIRLT